MISDFFKKKFKKKFVNVKAEFISTVNVLRSFRVKPQESLNIIIIISLNLNLSNRNKRICICIQMMRKYFSFGQKSSQMINISLI